MNLLILGAGGHGRVVMETAQAMGCFDEIAFLDDRSPNAVGMFNDYESFRSGFDVAFVAIGDNKLRSLWLERLMLVGYQITTLIHPRAYVSPSAVVCTGTIVEPLACINTGAVINTGSIISISTTIDHDCQIGSYSHIDCGVVLKPRTCISPFTTIKMTEKEMI